MKNQRKYSVRIKYKVIERYEVDKGKYGHVKNRNRDLKPHEKSTAKCLSHFGFNVEILAPSNIPGSKNPDIEMLGSFWEVKCPQDANESTIKTHFYKAIKQSGGKAIFDIRDRKGDASKVEKYITNLFITTREMRRIMIIKKVAKRTNIILDFIK